MSNKSTEPDDAAVAETDQPERASSSSQERGNEEPVDDKKNTPESSAAEIKALKATVDELLQVTKEENTRRTWLPIAIILGLIFGYWIGENILNPPLTIHQRECAKFGVECSP